MFRVLFAPFIRNTTAAYSNRFCMVWCVIALEQVLVWDSFNTFSPADFKTLKSTVPGHFTTLWKLRSTSTPSGQLARDAAEYYYSARAESVKSKLVSTKSKLKLYYVHTFS
jgi:hypothetical protein